MAYEVARVHGLIRSHIHEDGKEGFAEAWPLLPHSKKQTSKLSPDTPLLLDFPSDMNPWLESSPSSSLGSSTETETESDEEDDFIAGLAEQIAHSMLNEEDTTETADAADQFARAKTSGIPVFPCGLNLGSQKVAVSPQSSWSASSWSASWSESVSSSKQSSELSSPSTTPSASKSDAWKLLNEAAGEVGRLKISEERRHGSFPLKQSKQAVGSGSNDSRQGISPSDLFPRSCWKQPNQSVLPLPTPVCSVAAPVASVVPKDRNISGAAHGNRIVTRSRDEDRKLGSNVQCHQPQHRSPRTDGTGWSNRQNRPGQSKGAQHKNAKSHHNFGVQQRAGGKPTEWNPGQHWAGGPVVNGGSGMRAVFLGNPGSSRESAGTGVFLPRCVGGASDYRRKPACSTVLLPSRIVQVLNLNVEDMRSHPAPMPVGAVQRRSDFVRGHPPQMYIMELNSGASKADSGTPSAFPRKCQSARARHPSDVSAEYSLPTEWTY
ncbi:hypothetical protein R1sor_011476 [Riccia sorocarpa]|uniref:Uncharacterized protein n=1 Tax=Riccia sorocarpa TaxID=122646 RepID=A0ABD3I4V3_9MARC